MIDEASVPNHIMGLGEFGIVEQGSWFDFEALTSLEPESLFAAENPFFFFFFFNRV